MDLIAQMFAMYLAASTSCTALKDDLYKHGSEYFLVLNIACDNGQQWQSWQRRCLNENGSEYYGRMYFLQELRSEFAWYVNRFGEIQGGAGAQREEAYVPLCGS
jgi:hypothetical protein